VFGVVLHAGRRLLTRAPAEPAAPAGESTNVSPPTSTSESLKDADPASPLDLPVWAVVPMQGAHASTRHIEGSLADLLESIALTRGARGKVVLFLSGNLRQGRPAIAEALNSLAVGRGMLSFLAQLETEQPQGVVNLQNRFLQTNTNTVRATARSLLMLFSGRTADGQAGKLDIRTEFDIIVVDGTAIRNPVEIQSLASYIDYAVFLVSDTQQPDAIADAMRALAGNSTIVTGVVVDQAAA
jgi:hypothetical protein